MNTRPTCYRFEKIPGSFLFCFCLVAASILASCNALKSINNGSLPNDTTPIIGKAALSSAIEDLLLRHNLFGSSIGIKIIHPADGAILYQKNPSRLFHPASTVKLFTSTAALIHLGADYHFTTNISTPSGNHVKNHIDGDVFIIGSGDPSLTTADLTNLAKNLVKIGITKINGDIICDSSIFDNIEYGKGWMWDDQPYRDFAPINALSVNRNIIEYIVNPGAVPGAAPSVRMIPANSLVKIRNQAQTVNNLANQTQADLNNNLATAEPLSLLRRWKTQENIIDIKGTISSSNKEHVFIRNIVNPAIFFGHLFKQECNKAGIQVKGHVITGKSPSTTTILATHKSPPLAELLLKMNKESHNLDAELILKTIGAQIKGLPGTSLNGLEAVAETLDSMGMSENAYTFADGSGVSRYNLLTASTITDLLSNSFNAPFFKQLINSLAIAGEEGSMKDRMLDYPFRSTVKAKTGSMRGVSVLAGFVESPDSPPLAFAIMIEHFIGSSAPAHSLQDSICGLLTRFKSTSRE